jgi:hypothetical protein
LRHGLPGFVLYTALVAKTLYWQVIPDLLAICVQTNVPPSDEDWDRYLSDVMKHAKGLKGVLVYSESVGPTAPQRARVNESYKNAGVDIRTAIMSGSRMVRGVVTAMSWTLADNIKAFSTKDFEAAVKYLELTNEEQLRTRVMLKQLARGAEIEVAAFADESGQFAKKYKY